MSTTADPTRATPPPFRQWCPELVQALRAPFPDDVWREMQIPKKGGGTTRVPYIPWHRYAERLDQLVGPHGWTIGRPRWEVIGSPARLVMTAPFTILGVTKWPVATDDLEKVDKHSGGIEHVEGYGGPGERAAASLLKRGCALFGLGREDTYVRKGPSRRGGQGRNGRGADRREPPRRPADGAPAEGEPKASPAQRRKIDRLIAERLLPPEQIPALQARLGPELTRARASELIDHLSGLPLKAAGAAS
ncbi:MAG TPA: hypothetical protein VF158_10825 [Longimicrobiales bacterium]